MILRKRRLILSLQMIARERVVQLYSLKIESIQILPSDTHWWESESDHLLQRGSPASRARWPAQWQLGCQWRWLFARQVAITVQRSQTAKGWRVAKVEWRRLGNKNRVNGWCQWKILSTHRLARIELFNDELHRLHCNIARIFLALVAIEMCGKQVDLYLLIR